MTTVDDRGRQAAAALRRVMTADADVDADLDRVMARATALGIDGAGRSRRNGRPAWSRFPLLVAAVLVVAVVVGVIASRDRSHVVHERPATSGPSSPIATTASGSSVSDPSPSTEPSSTDGASERPATSPPASPTTAASPSTSLPPSTAPTSGTPVDVFVDDVVEIVEPVRTVIAAGTFGSGPGELGIERCSECDAARPWVPMGLPDGRVLVADAANHRWVVFERGDVSGGGPDAVTTIEIPWDGGVIPIDQPQVDDAGTVYAVMYGALGAGGTQAAELWVFDPSDLTAPLSRHPASSGGNAAVTLTPDAVTVDGRVIEGLVPVIAARRPTVTIVGVGPADAMQVHRVSVAQAGVAVGSFTYEAGTLLGGFGPAPGLTDGSVMVSPYLPTSDLGFVDRLFPDGRVVRLALPASVSMFGAELAGDDGFFRLEVSAAQQAFELVHYDLPS